MPQEQTPTPELQPLYQSECWNIPEGKTIFGFRRCEVMVYPGWAVVYDAANHAEIKRIPLTPDLRLLHFINFVSVLRAGGQKISIVNNSYSFMFSHVLSYVLLFAGAVINGLGTLVFGSSQQPNTVVTSIGLVLLFVGLAWSVAAFPRASAFVKACRRATGIA